MDQLETVIIEEEVECPVHGKYMSRSRVMFGKHFYEPCPKCAAKEKEKDGKYDEGVRIARLRDIVKVSGIPSALQGARLDSYVPIDATGGASVLLSLHGYLEGFKGKIIVSGGSRWFDTVVGPKSLLFVGASGTGKTHLACCLGQELLFADKIKSLKYVNTYDLLSEIKSTWRKGSADSEADVMRRYVDADFLIIDEVGVQFGSDVETLLFFNLYNKRLMTEKPTLLISNNNPDELAEIVGARSVDRMRMGEYFVFDWKSYRAGNR